MLGFDGFEAALGRAAVGFGLKRTCAILRFQFQKLEDNEALYDICFRTLPSGSMTGREHVNSTHEHSMIVPAVLLYGEICGGA